ncbi:MAG TPA: hypothetical protein VLM44_04050 [Lutibacter sp.]|nr:hypothetical protein [Lutibacter sp.]
MKNIKYLILLFLSLTVPTSCIDDSESFDQNAEGPNLAGFTNSRENVANVADGSEYPFTVKMKVAGPTVTDLTGDVTVTFEATAASTAVAGVHYKIVNPSTTLKKDENYLGFATVVMLTAGIDAPLSGPSPVLVLQAKTTSGDGNVIASGKPVAITLNYACDSRLAGTYRETTQYFRAGALVSNVSRIVTFTKTGVGEYRTSHVGHWSQADLGGTPGFTFYDVCGDITIPSQNLVDLYSNIVEGVAGASSVNPVTGSIYMEYTIVVPPATSDRVYYVTYVKQ